MTKLFNSFFSAALISFFIAIYPFNNAFSFNLNKMLKNLPQPDGASTNNSGSENNKQNKANPFGAIFGGKSVPSSTASSSDSSGKSGSSMAGMVCSEFRKKNPGILYASLSGADLVASRNSVSADLNMKLDDAKRLLQDKFENLGGAGWVHYQDANYSASFSNPNVKTTFIEYTKKPELRLEMAARLKRAANDSSMSDADRAEAKFGYALILARFEHVHKKSAVIEGLLNNAYSSNNVGALYVKALRMYKGYGVKKDVNAAANFTSTAAYRMEDLREEAERFSVPPLEWEAPTNLRTLNLTDKEFKGHKRNRHLAAMGDEMRRKLEASAKSSKRPALRRQAERLSSSFDVATGKLTDIFGISGKVAAERLKFQTAKARLDKKQQILETKIAVSKRTTKVIEDAIGKADVNLRPEAEKKAKEIRSQFDGLASRSFALMINMLSNFGLSEDLIFAMQTASRMRNDGCRFVYAMDYYFERANVAFSDAEKKSMGSTAKSELEDEVPPDDDE